MRTEVVCTACNAELTTDDLADQIRGTPAVCATCVDRAWGAGECEICCAVGHAAVTVVRNLAACAPCAALQLARAAKMAPAPARSAAQLERRAS